MTHERAFLQAIREEPDDDAHRLIYADWLEEQGGAAGTARAAFIRAQCRLATLPDDDPYREKLADEAAELLAEHERPWTEPLHDLAVDWQFSRGFLERATIRGEDFLRHAERLFESIPLRAIHLLIHARDVPHLAACPALQWVESLNFRRCHLGDRSLQLLLTSPNLKRLRALDLTGNGINTPGVQALVQSPVMEGLRRLDLSRNLGIGDKAVRLLASAPRAETLQYLGLAHTNVTVDGFYDLLQSNSLMRLSDLDLSDARFGLAVQTHSWQKPRDLVVLERLRSLDLSNTRLPVVWRLLGSPALSLKALYLRGMAAEAADADLLANSPALTSLTHLDLRNNSLGAAGARALAESPYLQSLTYLSLSHNNIRDTGASAIASSPHLKRLRELHLAQNAIGGPGLKALAGSADLARVRKLDLAGNFIGGDSVRALAESTRLSGLTCLDLSDACLEEDAARALAASANFARLHRLVLNKNLLGDGGVRALAQSPHLQRLSELDLRDNRIGKAGAEALAASKSWRRLRTLDLRANVFTDTQEALLRERFGGAVLL
jgi:uncharacterized protein (TIGR02996 family)